MMFFFQVAQWVLAYHNEFAELVDLLNLKNMFAYLYEELFYLSVWGPGMTPSEMSLFELIKVPTETCCVKMINLKINFLQKSK